MTLEEYFSRVFPVIGRSFEGKTIAFFGAKFCAPIMEAYSRCGLFNHMVFDSSVIVEGDNTALYYGREYEGIETTDALEAFFRSHNHLALNWNVRKFPSISQGNLEEVKKAVENVDLIVGGGTLEECALIESVAHDLSIPMISFSVFDGWSVNSSVYVWAPGLDLPVSAFTDSVGFIDSHSEIGINSRLEWLEVCDLVMNLSKSLIVRGSDHECSDMESLLFFQKRNIILRGTHDWPWWVYYLSPSKKEVLSRLFVKTDEPSYPLDLLLGERVMVLGCGTASLFAGESVFYFRNLLMTDCKPFSVYNPVRQLAGTHYVDTEVKPFVVCNILSSRVEPGAKWKEGRSTLCVTLSNSDYSFSAAELKIDGDDYSMGRFIALLDYYSPTIVIVAMGDLGANASVCEILRERGIKHIVPAAFPSATYFTMTIVDGRNGPCYLCLKGKLPIDYAPPPNLSDEAREMFYGGSQPATIFETLPSIHCLTRIVIELSLPQAARSPWFSRLLAEERTCLVGGNRAEKHDGEWAYGINCPGQVVSYGVSDIVGTDRQEPCFCGRINNHNNYSQGEGR